MLQLCNSSKTYIDPSTTVSRSTAIRWYCLPEYPGLWKARNYKEWLDLSCNSKLCRCLLFLYPCQAHAGSLGPYPWSYDMCPRTTCTFYCTFNDGFFSQSIPFWLTSLVSDSLIWSITLISKNLVIVQLESFAMIRIMITVQLDRNFRLLHCR